MLLTPTSSSPHLLMPPQTPPSPFPFNLLTKDISLYSPLRFRNQSLQSSSLITFNPYPASSPHLLMPPQHHGMGRRVAGGKVEDPLPCLYFFILVWQNANLIFRALSTLPGLNDHVDLVKKTSKIFLCLNISLRKRCLSDRRTLSHSAY